MTVANRPRWLSFVGLGEDGLDGLSAASRNALAEADALMGAKRHLALVEAHSVPGPESGSPAGTGPSQRLPAERIEWPIPFADGLPILAALRPKRVAVLASGDPFWFGAGSTIVRELGLEPGEWRAFPGPSAFSLVCARLGWSLERVATMGLHAAPYEILVPHIALGARVVATVRDGDAPAALARWLSERGWGATVLHVCESLGGPDERVSSASASALATEGRRFRHPACVAAEFVPEASGNSERAPADAEVPNLEVALSRALSLVPGRASDWFDNDGQITRAPLRAVALAELAPRQGDLLWDIGAGSGAIGIEWLLAHPANRAVAIERDPTRAGRIDENALRLGVPRLEIRNAAALGVVGDLFPPEAVFVGGGLDRDLLDRLLAILPAGCRLVAHAVTLETESILSAAHDARGGALARIEIARAAPLGDKRGMVPDRPVTQWSVTL